ncbi:MAG: pyrroline-5-carboxylate reductase [Actinomycetaceae bacterium]|nr:pyrroline-5-carboxylate reductase [Actinomycetaceae bacterium]
MKLGFIGLGAMGGAILQGILDSGACAPEDASYTDPHPSASVATTPGLQRYETGLELAHACDIVVLAVKPHAILEVCATIAPALGNDGPVVVSIAAGRDLATLQEALPAKTPVIRVMPNVAALVQEAMCALCPGEGVTDEQLASVKALLDVLGKTLVLPESSFSAFTALAGSSPAFVAQFVEALARAGLAQGLSKAQALQAATQAVKGTATLLEHIISEGGTTQTLIDMVSSPGGTTIAGLLAGEEHGFSASVAAQVDAVIARDREMAVG